MAVLVDNDIWMSLLVVQFIEDGIYTTSVWMETTNYIRTAVYYPRWYNVH